MLNIPSRAIKLLAIAAIVGTSALSFTARQTVSAAQDCPTKKDHYKIGFANLTEDVDFTKLVKQSIIDNAKKAGNIELVLADNHLDGATALNNAENFVAQGVDGVVEFQTDAKFGN